MYHIPTPNTYCPSWYLHTRCMNGLGMTIMRHIHGTFGCSQNCIIPVFIRHSQIVNNIKMLIVKSCVCFGWSRTGIAIGVAISTAHQFQHQYKFEEVLVAKAATHLTWHTISMHPKMHCGVTNNPFSKICANCTTDCKTLPKCL